MDPAARKAHRTTATDPVALPAPPRDLAHTLSPGRAAANLGTGTGRLAIVGAVGVPARYGGFETLAEALVTEAERLGISSRLTVYCSGPQTPGDRPVSHRGARLRYLPLAANGAQSLPYDLAGLAQAAWTRHDAILLLGVAGAMALPLLRGLTSARLLVHVDGIEWQRAKWRAPARRFLRWSEGLAARRAHMVIADNPAISAHIRSRYGREPVEIAYGGDQAVATPPEDISDLTLPPGYALSIARTEPENNIEMILETFADAPLMPLVLLGTWDRSDYGRRLLSTYGRHPHIRLLPAEYGAGRLRAIRDGAALYIHGHSAGGTNPGLVEMMHIGKPVAAFDCAFNRATTEGHAIPFRDSAGLRAVLPMLAGPDGALQAARLTEVARRNYMWSDIARAYFDLAGLTVPTAKASPRTARAL